MDVEQKRTKAAERGRVLYQTLTDRGWEFADLSRTVVRKQPGRPKKGQGEQDGLFTAKEWAKTVGCSESHVRRVCRTAERFAQNRQKGADGKLLSYSDHLHLAWVPDGELADTIAAAEVEGQTVTRQGRDGKPLTGERNKTDKPKPRGKGETAREADKPKKRPPFTALGKVEDALDRCVEDCEQNPEPEVIQTALTALTHIADKIEYLRKQMEELLPADK